MDNRIYGLFIGGALGDTIGSVAELVPGIPIFHPLDSLKMNIQPGFWQEATATTLALGYAYLGEPDAATFRRNLLNTEGFTSDGVLSNIDVGTETLLARGEPSANGGTDTGSLIRCAGLGVIYFNDYAKLLEESYRSSFFTHNSEICAAACKLYLAILDGILHGHSKKDCLNPLVYSNLILPPEIDRILDALTTYTLADLPGDANVVDALTLALYIFKKTNNYHEGMALACRYSLKPSHVCSLFGQLAGAYYGLTDIKTDWISTLARRELITDFIAKLK